LDLLEKMMAMMEQNQNWDTPRQLVRQVLPIHSGAGLGSEGLDHLLREILSTYPNEISCDACFEHLHALAETVLADKEPAEALPLVRDHLDHCRDCREEFEGLWVALRAMA
jgi:hypothetical protein